MAQKKHITKRCIECTQAFHPWNHKQTHCSMSCAAARRTRMKPHNALAFSAAGRAARTKAAQERLARILPGLSAQDAYYLGRKHGYDVCLKAHRLTRKPRADQNQGAA